MDLDGFTGCVPSVSRRRYLCAEGSTLQVAGAARVLREGDDITLIANGIMVVEALGGAPAGAGRL